MKVVVFHNQRLFTEGKSPLAGYEPGDLLVQVDEVEMGDEGSIIRHLEWVFRAYNNVDGSERSSQLRIRSLSVGDAVALDGKLWACAPFGWDEIKESNTEVVGR